jgi:cytochrome c oxidase subunit 3
MGTTVTQNPWGIAADPGAVSAALQNTPDANLAAIVHSLGHGGTHENMSRPEMISAIQAANIHVTTPGPIAFGGYFFGITGFHGFHVFSGVIINLVMLIKTRLKHFELRGHYEMIEKAGLYWHFVDLVWVFVFLCFYLV